MLKKIGKEQPAYLLSNVTCVGSYTASTSMQHRTGKQGPMAHDVNTRLALGALNAGIGHTYM